MLTELKNRIADELDRVAARDGPDTTDGASRRSRGHKVSPEEARVRLLGQLLSALPKVESSMLPVEGAGFGSTVVLEDLDRGGEVTYQLLAGDFIDIDADQVSLASPIGYALLGRSEGEEIEVNTPRGTRRFRIARLTTVHDLLGPTEAPHAAAV